MIRIVEIININISIKHAIVEKNAIVLNTKIHCKDSRKQEISSVAELFWFH